MTELMTAKEAREMTAEFRMNANAQKAISAVGKEIKYAVTQGRSSVTTRVINGAEGGKEIEMVISALKSAGYTVEKKTVTDHLDIYHSDMVVHIISWE